MTKNSFVAEVTFKYVGRNTYGEIRMEKKGSFW